MRWAKTALFIEANLMLISVQYYCGDEVDFIVEMDGRQRQFPT